MEHLFLPYELAKLAKEKGFKENCFGGYKDSLDFQMGFYNIGTPGIELIILAPLYQQIVDWLRETHGIVVSVGYNFPAQTTKPWHRGRATCVVQQFKNKVFCAEYNEALNKAIEEAFKMI